MYTTEQAIALAQEVGAEMTRPLAPHEFSVHAYTFSEQELTAFANAVRKQALLEAADLARGKTWANHSAYVVLEKLRRMAEGE